MMQLSSQFLGGRTAVTVCPTPLVKSGTATRQLTTCMAKKKGAHGAAYQVVRCPRADLVRATRTRKSCTAKTEAGQVRHVKIDVFGSLELRRVVMRPGIRCIVTLECTEARGEGATPSRYTTQKASTRAPHVLAF